MKPLTLPLETENQNLSSIQVNGSSKDAVRHMLSQPRTRLLPNAPLPAGKLPMPLLQQMLARYAGEGPGVKVGAAVGRDAAVIDCGDRQLIVKTDPITFVADDIGSYALLVNANDVACMGGEPKWFLTTVLLPAGKTHAADVERIFEQISQACKSITVSLCGGHTEITPAVTQPVVIGCLLGEAPASRALSSQKVQPEDYLLLLKGIAIEATSILGREKQTELGGMFDQQFVRQCQRFLQYPGISVLPVARQVWDHPEVHALHDPTEGGLANAIHELLEADSLGVEIDLSQVPIYPETKLLCEMYGLDPFGVIASGALLVAGTERACNALAKKMHRKNVPAAIIGRVLPSGEERSVLTRKQRSQLPLFKFDEIIKALS